VLDCPVAPTAFFEPGLPDINGSKASLAGSDAGEVLHDLRVSVHRSEGFAVLRRPLTQPEAFCAEFDDLGHGRRSVAFWQPSLACSLDNPLEFLAEGWIVGSS